MRRVSSAAAVLVWAGILAAPVTAVDAPGVRFGEAVATPTFDEGIAFSQEVELPRAPQRVELELTLPGLDGALVLEAPAPGGSGAATLRYDYDLRADRHILPNTRLSARWVVTFDDGTSATGPPVRVTYRDTRFEWQTREGEIVRVHWYEGGDEFGRRALAIGERAVWETAALLGVEERDPIDFFIYADEDVFRTALGPGTRENVGGQANAEIRTLFALIRPSEINAGWVDIVIPHELVHLVFDTAVDNPYHFPPKWLNEGLAVWLSESYDAVSREAVESAAARGELMPLDALTGQFPTSFERFTLGYAESVSAVDFIVREHGRDALVRLIRSYADGRTDDEAFEGAIGMTVAELDEAWRADLGAADPVSHGPQPAPPGPLPPGWDGSPAPGAPDPSDAAPPSPWPTPSAAAGPGGAAAADSSPLVAMAGIAVVVVVAIGVLVARRRQPA